MGEERTVGLAVDFSPCSKKALSWALDNIIRKGDHLILVNIQPEGYYEEGEMQLWEATGYFTCNDTLYKALCHLAALIPLSEFSDPHVMKRYGVKPDAETLDMITCAAAQKEFVPLMKIYWGDAREKLCEAVDNVPLSCLVVGNRGLGKLKRAIMGSVSNHVVNNARCPVTVVKDQHEQY